MRRFLSYRSLLLIMSLSLALVVFSCSSSSRPRQDEPLNMKTVVATVDGEYVTLRDYFEQKKRSFGITGSDMTKMDIAWEAVYLKAAFLSVDRFDDYDPNEVHRLVKNRRHESLTRYMLDDLFTSRAQLSDSAVDSFYQTNIGIFTVPEKRHAVHILVSDNPTAWRAEGLDVAGMSKQDVDKMARKKAREYYEQIRAGADIGELAGKYSHDGSSKESNGDLGYFIREEMVPKFSEVTFAMKKGELSKPFKTRFGYHVVKMIDIQEKRIDELDLTLSAEVERQLRGSIIRTLALAFVDSLVQAAEYEWNEEVLSADFDSYDTREWLCIVNGNDTVEAGLLRELEVRHGTGNQVQEPESEKRKELIKGQIVPYLLSSVAKKRGYVELDTMKAVYNYYRGHELVGRMYRGRRVVNFNPAEDEMREFYDSHLDEFQPEKPLRVQQIAFKDSAEAAAVKLEIEQGLDFEEAAMKYYPGDEDVKRAAFDLGWIIPGEISKEFYNAAWITPIGKISGPVRSAEGFHLIKVLEKITRKNFAQAQGQIRSAMAREKNEELDKQWVRWVTKGHDIEIFDDLVAQIDLDQEAHYQAVADSISQVETGSDTLDSGV